MRLSLLVLLSAAALSAADLSNYRGFQFGMTLSAAVKQSGMDPSEVINIQKTPARIDQLLWTPERFSNGAADADPVQQVALSFYNGQLARMVIDYDSQKTAGMKVQDFIDAMIPQYGAAVLPSVPTILPSTSFSEGVNVMAHWEDAGYSVNLVESPYGERFGLITTSKRLDGLAQKSVAAKASLDEQQAPDRLKTDERDARAKMAKERAVNRENFRP